MRSGLAVAAVALWLAPAAAGADVFRYETEEGTISFADELKRIPARYRDQAERLPEKPLWDHPRLTIVESRRDDSLGSQPVVEAPAEAEPTDTGRSLAFEVSPGLWIDLEANADEPVYIEREHRWHEGALRAHTVVRQGDRILAVRIHN